MSTEPTMSLPLPGVLESLFFALLGKGLLSLAWNGGLSFCVAYTLYWCMTCSQKKTPMFYSLIFIMLYVAFNVYMGLQKLIYIVPALLYFGKALCDVLMLVNGCARGARNTCPS